MNSLFMNYNIYINPSDIIEYKYCKRFIYYMKCLLIPQNEHSRYKVQKGRDIHNKKASENIRYLRKKLFVINKLVNVELCSEKYGIKGIIDEILFFNDGTAAPLDYKFAKYNNVVYETYKSQMVMYALMIEEVYKVKVNNAFIVYCLSDNYIYKLNITENLRQQLIKDINEYENILKGFFPEKTKYKKRCTDCCYRNICVK